ncbi:MAG: hypothetical protein OXB88_07615 [Bacteriovoracales bacterium]|nr:hypothetical protein [Bacteriovoracales bacterium]
MKYIWTKALMAFFLSWPSWGKAPILVSFNQREAKAKMAAKLLNQRWSIPRSLIELKRSHPPCQKESLRTIHLCFQNSGEMVLIQYDREVVDESFRIFFR